MDVYHLTSTEGIITEAICTDGSPRVVVRESSQDAKDLSSKPTVVVVPSLDGCERTPSPLPFPITVSNEKKTQDDIPPRSSAWDSSRVNWSRSSSTPTATLSSVSNLSLSSCSDEESSRECVDLEEERQRLLSAQQIVNVMPAESQQTSNGILLSPATLRVVPESTTLTIPMLARQRNVTDTSEMLGDVINMHGANRAMEIRRSSHNESNHDSDRTPPHSASVLFHRNSRGVTAHSRRNLVVLFLVAVYTTFGLTSPNIPAGDDLLFPDNMIPVVDVVELVDTPKPISLAVQNADKNANTQGELHEGEKASAQRKSSPKGKFAFARRNNRQMLTFRRKEMSDFYHQKALRDESTNLSWYYYVNCTVLVAVALWAWRERFLVGIATTAANRSSTQLRANFLN